MAENCVGPTHTPSDSAENDAPSGWWRDTPESRRLLAIERHRLDVAEATYGLDKRQSRRVRRRMGRVIPSEAGQR